MTYEPSRELADLLGALIDDAITPEENARLSEILSADAAARELYCDLIGAHAMMIWLERGSRGPAPDDLAVAEATPPVPSDRSPNLGVATAADATDGAVGYLSSHGPVAYWTAAVVLGIGLLVGVFVHVFHPERTADPSSRVAKGWLASRTEVELVGKISGMIDCQWADESTATVPDAHVPLGRKYALRSGVMEISYDTGARVSLEGPATYEVESLAGGYLSRGKLAVRVETGERGNRKMPAPGSSASGPPSSALFAVRTPSATLTDLGTEFGVEVDESGATESHVVRGAVEVRVSGPGASKGRVVTMNERESFRVRADEDGKRTVERIVFRPEDFRASPGGEPSGDRSGLPSEPRGTVVPSPSESPRSDGGG